MGCPGSESNRFWFDSDDSDDRVRRSVRISYFVFRQIDTP